MFSFGTDIRQIRVLNVITGGLISDGITTSWLNFCKEFNAGNLNNIIKMDFVNISGFQNTDIVQRFEDLGIKVHTLSSRSKYPFRYFQELYSLLRKERYDIIHVNGSSYLMSIELFAALLAGTKARVAHSRNTTCNYKKIHLLLKYPFCLLCNGRAAAGHDAGVWLFGNKPFKVIHNGKDLNLFSFSNDDRISMRFHLGLKDNFVITHVGKFNRQKNHAFLIDIFDEVLKRIPEAVLLLIGDGPLQSEIMEQAKTKGLDSHIIYAGVVDNVHYFLQGADIMVFPSRYEGLPNIIIETQAAGLPSVISDVITEECAVCDLVEFKSLNCKASEWADSIVRIHKSSTNRAVASENAIARLKDNGFDISCSAVELLNFYQSLLNK